MPILSRSLLLLALTAACAHPRAPEATAMPDDLTRWAIHDLTRPQPPIVTPPPASDVTVSRPPSDAIVLFDGKDLSAWRRDADGGPAPWTVRDGYFEVAKGTGMIRTAEGFGSVQLHVEWMAPLPAEGEGQDRGNSGIFLMGRYEVQVLDSYGNRTYPDGQAAAVYGQYPPLVNASRPPGEWQSYDIVFHAPDFGPDRKLVRRARVTVLHNGVLVQDNVELTGPTGHHVRPPYEWHERALPLALQDHGHPVRYRNIWVRKLAIGE